MDIRYLRIDSIAPKAAAAEDPVTGSLLPAQFGRFPLFAFRSIPAICHPSRESAEPSSESTRGFSILGFTCRCAKLTSKMIFCGPQRVKSAKCGMVLCMIWRPDGFSPTRWLWIESRWDWPTGTLHSIDIATGLVRDHTKYTKRQFPARSKICRPTFRSQCRQPPVKRYGIYDLDFCKLSLCLQASHNSGSKGGLSSQHRRFLLVPDDLSFDLVK